MRVTLDEPPPEQVTLTPRPPRERVAFVLQRADGQPLGRKVKVHLYNVYGELDGSTGGTWSDEAGAIAYDRLPCTRYHLWIEAPVAEDDSLPGALFRGLDVPAGEGAHTVTLTVPAPGAAEGRLVRADGNPAQGYMVAVQTGTVPDEGSAPEGWPAAYARGALECYAQAEVGTDGTFALRGLTPGKHSLDIRPPGEREAWSTISGVEVAADEVTDLGTVELLANGWEYMFDRRTLDGWMASDFYGQKEVRIENDRIVLTMGTDMTGITWTKELPRIDYEVSLQAMRVDGSDFFCGLTVPVQEDYCSLILGGWGGSVVGLSSLDAFDASENETSRWIQFDERRWYRVRVRVTATNIKVWLDEDRIIDANTENRDISTRIEMERSKPFGIATWCTTGAIRDIRIRRLDDGAE